MSFSVTYFSQWNHGGILLIIVVVFKLQVSAILFISLVNLSFHFINMFLLNKSDFNILRAVELAED